MTQKVLRGYPYYIVALALAGLGLMVSNHIMVPDVFANSGGSSTYYDLTVCTPAEGGTISWTPAGSTFVAGTQITLTATLEVGYEIDDVGWTGAGSGTDLSTTITLNGDASVCVGFKLKTYNFAPCTPSNGSLSINPPGPDIEHGTEVTVVAVPDAGYRLVGWNGDFSGGSYSQTLEMTDNVSACVAFTEIQDPTYPLVVCNPVSGGNILRNPSYDTFPRYGVVKLDVHVDPGNVFVQWLEDLDGSRKLPEYLTIDYGKAICVDIRPSPAIALINDSPISWPCGVPFEDPGYFAVDDVDGDITASVTVTGTVDHTAFGNYTLTYGVTDSEGNSRQETRIVDVVDVTPPTITLIGDAPMTVDFNAAYSDPGATALDQCEGDLTGLIVETSTPAVNTTIPGYYEVVYDVSDSSGNTASETRIVNVTGLTEDLEHSCEFFFGVGVTDCSSTDNNGKEESGTPGTYLNVPNGIPDRIEFLILDAILGDVGHPRRQEILDAWNNNVAQIQSYLTTMETQNPGVTLPEYRTVKALAAYTLLGQDSHFFASERLKLSLGVSEALPVTGFTFPSGLAYDSDLDGDGYTNGEEWSYAVLYESDPANQILNYLQAAQSDENVIFPDPVLNGLVRSVVGVNNGFIYESDVVGATPVFDTLVEWNSGDVDPRVADLTGLERCTDLTELRLVRQNVSNISAVASLTNLQTLDFSFNSISDISPVAGLTNLTQLKLGGNDYSDATPVAGLASLEWLVLGLTNVTDITPVLGLSALETLNLDFLTLPDVSLLSTMSSLVTLRLSDTNVSDIDTLSPLAGTGALTNLYLYRDALSNDALCTDIPTFESDGVTVFHDGNICQRFLTVTHEGNGHVDVDGTTYVAPVSADEDSTVSVEAIPDAGWALQTWENGLTGTTNPADVTMTANKTVNAVFEQVFTLNASIKDGADAIVSISPASPGETPTNTYFIGEQVTLTATENTTWDFVRWEDSQGAQLTTDLSLTVTMTSDHDVVAVFETYVLEVEAPDTTITVFVDGEEITANENGDWGAPDGVEITVVATPDAGNNFGYWEDENGEAIGLKDSYVLSGGGFQLKSAPATSNVLLKAHIVPDDKAELVVFMPSAWQGSITVDQTPLAQTSSQYTKSTGESRGKSLFEFGAVSEVELSMSPAAVDAFYTWQTLSGVVLPGSEKYTCKLRAGDSKVLFVGLSDPDDEYFGIRYTAIGEGGMLVDRILIEPGQSVAAPLSKYSTGISVVAQPEYGWNHVAWNDALALTLSTSPEIVSTVAHTNLDTDGDNLVTESDVANVKTVMDGGDVGGIVTDLNQDGVTDKRDFHLIRRADHIQSVVGVFTPQDTYTVSASVSPAVGGVVSDPKPQYFMGERAVLEATPAPGYYFEGWSGDVIRDSPVLLHEVTENTSVTANFHVEDRPTLLLFGAEKVELQPYETFNDPGAYAEDINGVDISDQITVTITEGKAEVGWDEYRYEVTDSMGRKAKPVSRFVLALGNVNKSLNRASLEEVCANCRDASNNYVDCYVKKIVYEPGIVLYDCILERNWSNTPDAEKYDPEDINVEFCGNDEFCDEQDPFDRPDRFDLRVNIVPEGGDGQYLVTDGTVYLHDGANAPWWARIFPEVNSWTPFLPWHWDQIWLDHSQYWADVSDEFGSDTTHITVEQRVKPGREDYTVFDYWEVNGDWMPASEDVNVEISPRGSEVTAHFRPKSGSSTADPDTFQFGTAGVTAFVEPGFEEHADVALFYHTNADENYAGCVGTDGDDYAASSNECWSDYQEKTKDELTPPSIVPVVRYDENFVRFLGWWRKLNNAESWGCSGISSPEGYSGLCDPQSNELYPIPVRDGVIDVYIARFESLGTVDGSCGSISVLAVTDGTAGKVAEKLSLPTEGTGCRYRFTATEEQFFRWQIDMVHSDAQIKEEVLDRIDYSSHEFEITLPTDTISFSATANYDANWEDADADDVLDHFDTESLCGGSPYGNVTKEVVNAENDTFKFTADSDGRATWAGWSVKSDDGVPVNLNGVDLDGMTLTLNARSLNGASGRVLNYTVTANYTDCVPIECAQTVAPVNVEGCGTATVDYESDPGGCKIIYTAIPTGAQSTWSGWDTDGELNTIEEEDLTFSRVGLPSVTPTAIFEACDEVQDPEQEAVTDSCEVVEETAETESDSTEVDPVYWHSGEVYETETDIAIEGPGTGLFWTRKYRSRIAKEDVQGNGWDHSYNMYVVPSQLSNSTDLVLHRGMHRIERFTDNGDGTWSYGERFDIIEELGDGSLQLQTPDGMYYRFNSVSAGSAPGKLVEIKVRYGDFAPTVLAYDASNRLSTITDARGNVLTVTYDASGARVDDVSVSNGAVMLKKVNYIYYGASDSGGSLGDLKTVEVENVLGAGTIKKATYTYYKGIVGKPELTHNLKSVSHYRDTDGDGIDEELIFVENTYGENDDDSYDRLRTQRWGDSGDLIDLRYEDSDDVAFSRVTTVNDRNGNVTHFYYDENNKLGKKVEYNTIPGQEGAADKSYGTTLKNNRATGTSLITKYTWNASGRLTDIVYPSGRAKSYIYDDTNPDPKLRGNVKETQFKESESDTSPLVERMQYSSCSCGKGLDYYIDPKGNITDHDFDELASPPVDGGPGNYERIHSVTAPAPFDIDLDYTARTVYDGYGRELSFLHPANASGGHKRQDWISYYDSEATADPDVLGPLQISVSYLNQGGSAGETRVVTIARDRLGRLVGIDIPKATWEAGTFTPGVDVGTKIVYDGYGRVSEVYTSIGGPEETYTLETIDYYTDGLPKSRTIQEFGHSTGISVEESYTEYAEYDILGMLMLKKERTDSATGHMIETRYEYDENRNLVKIQVGQAGDPANHHVENYQYNSRDLVTKKTVGGLENDKRVEVSYTYDADGRAEGVFVGATAPKVNIYQYDGYGRVSKIIRPEDVFQRFWYDKNGNVTDAIVVGPETDGGLPKLLSHVNYKYDNLDRVTSEKRMKVNGAPSYTETANPPAMAGTPFTRSFTYTPNSQIKTVSSSTGYGEMTTYTYDGMNRVKTTEDAKGNKKTYTYNDRSYLTGILEDAVSDSNPGTGDRTYNTTILRDHIGRSYQVTNNASETTLFERDRFGNVVKLIEPGQTDATATIKEFDGLGRLVHTKTRRAIGSSEFIETFHAWDDVSRRESSTDPSGVTTTYSYNALSQLETISLPKHNLAAGEFLRKQEFNRYGELETATDANGTVFTMLYDDLGRLTSRASATGAGVTQSGGELFKYDGLSRVIEATKGASTSTVTRKYDTLSNLREESLAHGGYTNTSTFTWDGLGNITSIGYQGGRSVAYDYDISAGLDNIDDSILASTITYDHLGRGRTEAIGFMPSLSANVGYDGSGYRVGTIDYLDTNSDYIYSANSSWTGRGNLDTTHIFDGLNSALKYDRSYDNAARLTEMSHDFDTSTPATDSSVDYDHFPSGAHERVTRTTGGSFTTDNVMRDPASNFPHVYQSYTVDGPTTDITYDELVDENGNRKEFYHDTDSHDGYDYDQDNRLVTYTDLDGATHSYVYDAFGRRIAKTSGGQTTRYVYAGWDVIEERNGSNQLLRSFLLSGQSTDGVVSFTNYNATTGAVTGSYFYLKDARGNVVALADTSANVVERYVYDPFGVPTRYDASWSPVSTLTAVGNPYYFQSRRHDSESGLYYYRMRYLDPVVGRFITPDPIGAWGDAMNVGNPYSFVGNNPWTYSDPLGLEGDFAPVWHHILPREIFGEFFGDSLDEMGNGYWLPSIFHNAQGVGIHNTIEEFGADWNAQWRYYDDYFWDEWRVDIRTRPDLLRHIAARMSNMPRFKPAFDVGMPATRGYENFLDRTQEFRDESARCAAKMYDNAEALGLVNRKGILAAMKALGKRGLKLVPLFGAAAAASDIQAYGLEEGALRNAPVTELYYMGKDGILWAGDQVVRGPGGVFADHAGGVSGEQDGPVVWVPGENWDDFWANY